MPVVFRVLPILVSLSTQAHLHHILQKFLRTFWSVDGTLQDFRDYSAFVFILTVLICSFLPTGVK